jgi:hypothetical protein
VPQLNANGTDYTNFYFKVIDSSNQASSYTYQCKINVIPVNDTPLSSDTSISAFEDQIYTFKSSDFNFTDYDNQSLAGMQITSIPLKGSFKYNNNTVGVGSIISSFNLLTYKALANEFGTNYASFKFKLKDASGEYSLEHVLTINVVSVNDLPTSKSYTSYMDEDIPYYFNKTVLKFSDIDKGDTLWGLNFPVLPAKGTLRYGKDPIVAGKVYSPVDSVNYLNNLNENGADYVNISFKVVDNYLGVSDSSYLLTLHVNAMPDRPSSKNFTMSFYEDSLQSFSTQTIPFYDVDGQNIAGVIIDSLPQLGEVFYSSKAAATGTVYSDLSKLKFLGPANANGTAFTSLYLSVVDPTNLISAASYKVTINLIPVNDPPNKINLSSNHISENMPNGSIIGYFSASDIDSYNFTYKLAASADLSDLNNGSFTIKDSSLLTNISLDYENQYLYFIYVSAFDDMNAKFSVGFTIYVDDDVESSINRVGAKVKLYPNPASQYITFESDLSFPLYYRIIDIQGREMAPQKIMMEQKINISDYKPGYYILQIIAGDKLLKELFIKE